MNELISLPSRLVLMAIRAYQKTLSPDHGFFAVWHPHGFCRYAPTCSEYTYQAIARRGLIRGIAQGAWRIIRCNPFSRGGYDPII